MGDMSICEHNQAIGYCDECSPNWEMDLLTAEAIDNESKTNADCTCICKGNWRLLVKECEDLLNRKYMDSKGKVWKFFGLVHASDDYYYGMYRDGKMELLSCVGNIEGFGYTLIEDSNEVNER